MLILELKKMMAFQNQVSYLYYYSCCWCSLLSFSVITWQLQRLYEGKVKSIQLIFQLNLAINSLYLELLVLIYLKLLQSSHLLHHYQMANHVFFITPTNYPSKDLIPNRLVYLSDSFSTLL